MAATAVATKPDTDTLPDVPPTRSLPMIDPARHKLQSSGQCYSHFSRACLRGWSLTTSRNLSIWRNVQKGRQRPSPA